KELDFINVVWCNPEFKTTGWSLNYDYKNVNPSKIFMCDKIEEIYKKEQQAYTGRTTIQLLYDRYTNKIINNNSKQILRILNSHFNSLLKGNVLDLYPENIKNELDIFCDEFEQRICKDTYRAGHAIDYEDYKKLFNSVFEYLDQLDEKLYLNP